MPWRKVAIQLLLLFKTVVKYSQPNSRRLLPSFHPLSSLDLSVLGSLLGEFNILSGNAQSMMEDMSVLTRSLYNSDNPSDPTTVVGAVNAISQGSNSVSEGAGQLQSGASRLSSGASDLSSGLFKTGFRQP